MATRTISLELEAYDKLRAARRHPGESFSDVILRARWPEEAVTAAQFLERCRVRGPVLKEEELRQIESFKFPECPPQDKWRSR